MLQLCILIGVYYGPRECDASKNLWKRAVMFFLLSEQRRYKLIIYFAQHSNPIAPSFEMKSHAIQGYIKGSNEGRWQLMAKSSFRTKSSSIIFEMPATSYGTSPLVIYRELVYFETLYSFIAVLHIASKAHPDVYNFSWCVDQTQKRVDCSDPSAGYTSIEFQEIARNILAWRNAANNNGQQSNQAFRQNKVRK
jgi:hypothetical protein